MRWRKVCLAGVGLLGGSLGMALRKRGLADRIEGYVRRPASVQECVGLGAVDGATTDLRVAVRGSDLVVLCTPLAQMGELSRQMTEALEPGAIVTDVGSVKGPLVADLEPWFESHGVYFIGSHPMAGSEKMGVGAARPDLFQNAICVVTPTPRSQPAQVERVAQLWVNVGARTLRLSPELHDELVARSSHLPHVLAAHLTSLVLDPHRAAEQSQLCANGFRDSTRIASGSPEMWRDIVLMNKEKVRRVLQEYSGQLRDFDELLDKGDSAAIEKFFQNAKLLRDSWANGTSSSPE